MYKELLFFSFYQPRKLLPEVKVEKPEQKSSDVSGTLAGLFAAQQDRPRHPWSKEGEFNIGATYGGPMGMSGGFLGIRTGMPRMPSFKVC